MDANLLISVGSALVSIGVAAGGVIARSRVVPDPRDSALPPATPSLVSGAQLDALAQRIEAVEGRVEAHEERERLAEQHARDFRERVLERIARIMERLRLHEPHGGQRGERDSDG
jgi:hypothetical protein